MDNDALNPYASPQSVTRPIVSIAAQEIWREGDVLVVRTEATLPPRCIKCNAPIEGNMLRRRLFWHRPAIYGLILIGVFVYIIAAVVVQKKAVVDVGLCSQHRSQRNRGMLMAFTAFILGIVVLFVGGFVEKGAYIGYFVLVAAALMLFGAIYGIVRSRLLTPKRIDANFAWLKGACPESLNEIEIHS